jgi:hypothetical protein
MEFTLFVEHDDAPQHRVRSSVSVASTIVDEKAIANCRKYGLLIRGGQTFSVGGIEVRRSVSFVHYSLFCNSFSLLKFETRML